MNGKSSKIFFSGIGGSGISAIAGFLADKGHIIAGSDRAFEINPDHPVKKLFQASGINIFPQDGSGINTAYDLVVFSTAVESDNPEIIKARKFGTLLKTRPEFLAEITSSFKTIAVSGTSGKSTASGMLAFLMERLGMKPNFIGGGRVKQFKSSLNPGNYLSGDSDHLIIEACESDGSIVNYRPCHSIILNLSLDHNPVSKTSVMFKTLMKNTAEKIIVNADDKNLTRITDKKAVTFSIYNSSDYRAKEILYRPFSTAFSLHETRFTLPMPGRHNLYNALSCIAFLSEIGISPDAAAKVMPAFQGLDRRFDVLHDDGKSLVIDDYAHNPHKISALMQTVKELRDSICYIFQPHGFSPTKLMKKEYIETFTEHLRESDHLILLPIYYAGGSAGKDISSSDLADEIKAAGKSAESVKDRKTVLNTKKIVEYNAYVVFGARDETLSGFAKQIAKTL